MTQFVRLQFVKNLLAALFMFTFAASASAAAAVDTVEIYKSATCGCCTAWATHMREAGFKVLEKNVENPSAIRAKFKMPDRYGSCHTARVGGYVVEGHVPAADVKRLLSERPKAIGIAVPAMPPGSPGMEGPRAVPYNTLLVSEQGQASVYAKH